MMQSPEAKIERERKREVDGAFRSKNDASFRETQSPEAKIERKLETDRQMMLLEVKM